MGPRGGVRVRRLGARGHRTRARSTTPPTPFPPSTVYAARPVARPVSKCRSITRPSLPTPHLSYVSLLSAIPLSSVRIVILCIRIIRGYAVLPGVDIRYHACSVFTVNKELIYLNVVLPEAREFIRKTHRL